jgi:hypothetical protein
MINLTNFKFDKPYYRQSEFLLLFSISESCLKRYVKEWTDVGKNPEDMGHLNIKGFKEICWIPITFINWLVENKIEVPVRFDYQVSEQHKLKTNILNIPKKLNQQLKGVQ